MIIISSEKDIIAENSPNATPMAAEAKNIRQKLPTAAKNASAPDLSAIAGDAKPRTDLEIKMKKTH